MGSGQFSFSQAQGYEEIPSPLRLEELPKEARTHIWNLFYLSLKKSSVVPRHSIRLTLGPPWKRVFEDMHASLDNLPLDEWDADFESFCIGLRTRIEAQPFNKVFDLIEFVVRHRQCPPRFVTAVGYVFQHCRLAYTLELGPPPAIVPAATQEEGAALVRSLRALRQAGLASSAQHLHRASACINDGDWAGSIRESIHAVESVARQLDPKGGQTLASALKSLERKVSLHPALKKAFDSLYGYSSDEQGIRHPLLDHVEARVGRDEAVFMLGACASFASYLWHKHAVGEHS